MLELLSSPLQEDLFPGYTETISLSCPPEELRPIRIGAMAVQPQPDPSGRIYVGLAAMLPADLQNLCSCAGLVYLQIIREVTNDLSRVAVAAQPRYFSADAQCRTRHVRPHMFSTEQLSQLLEWDRSLAGMETDDVQGLLAVKQLPRIQQQQFVVDQELDQANVAPCADPEPPVQKQDGPRRLLDRHRVIDVDLVTFVPDRGVILPIDAVRNILNISSHPALPTLLLQAVLRQLRVQLQSERRWAERQAIKQQERRIRQLYQQRDHLPMKKLVQYTPIYGRGRGKYEEIVACRVDIDLPAA